MNILFYADLPGLESFVLEYNILPSQRDDLRECYESQIELDGQKVYLLRDVVDYYDEMDIPYETERIGFIDLYHKFRRL